MTSPLQQRIDLESFIEERCMGCPAIIANDLGIVALASLGCRYIYVVPHHKQDDVGCKKGPVDSSKILTPNIRAQDYDPSLLLGE
jgi:hypothetical protein